MISTLRRLRLPRGGAAGWGGGENVYPPGAAGRPPPLGAPPPPPRPPRPPPRRPRPPRSQPPSCPNVDSACRCRRYRITRHSMDATTRYGLVTWIVNSEPAAPPSSITAT